MRKDELREALIEALSDNHGDKVLSARAAGEARSLVADAHVDLVMIDDGHGFDGCEFLGRIRLSNPDIVRVLAFGTTSRAANA